MIIITTEQTEATLTREEADSIAADAMAERFGLTIHAALALPNGGLQVVFKKESEQREEEYDGSI